MKRSRNDQILACVNHYLRHRQFTDFANLSERKSQPGMCDVKDFTLLQATRNSDASSETISFSSLCGDAAACEQQYSRFKSFVLDSIEPYHRELNHLLYPMFVHFFLELMFNGHKQQAQKFFVRYQAMFVEPDDNKPLMAMLATMSSKDDMRLNKLVSEFSEKRYHIELSEVTFQYLMKYFKKDDNMLCLQIISRHLDISVINDYPSEVNVHDPSSNCIEQHSSLSSPARPTLASQGLGMGLDVKPSLESGLSALQRIIQRVEQGVPSLPSICLYTLQHSNSSICTCVSLCEDDSLLAAGFQDSSVLVCPILPQQPSSAQRSKVMPEVKVRVNQVHLAGDYPDDVQQKLSNIDSPADRMFPPLRRCSVPEDGAMLRAHNGAIYSTRFMHERDILLSASADKTIRLWDMASCANIVRYLGHSYPVFDIDVSDVANTFVSCSYDQTARLWSTDRIHPIRVFIGHTRGINCVRFHPNSNYIATGSSDHTVRMWSLQDAQPVRLLQGHSGAVTSLTFSPNGKYLASAGEDNRVKVWDLASGSLFKDLRGHTDVVYSLSFNAQCSLLASGGLDGTIKLWDMREAATSTMAAISTGSKPTVEASSSSELLASYNTKSSSVLSLKFSKRNFLQAVALQR